MPINVEIKHFDRVLNQELNAVAKSVIGQFHRLPDLRLLVFWDDEDAPFFRTFGEENRGLFVVIKETPTKEWPDYVTEHIFVCDSSLPVEVRFDNVIYLYGTTCADSVGRVMTFAHELQHFVQYGFSPILWYENRRLWDRVPAYEIPTEWEARIVAKRIAKELCGPESVEQYIARKIEFAKHRLNSKPHDMDFLKAWQNEIDDWKFIQQLDESISFDLAAETNLTSRRLE